MRIETNVNSVSSSLLSFQASFEMASRSAKRLATGSRFASISDDPSAIGRSQMFNGLVKNTADAISNMENAVSALSNSMQGYTEIRTLVQRMREFATQANNEVMTNYERSNLQKQLSQFRDKIDETAQNTTYNGANLIASNNTLTVQAGPYSGQTQSLNFFASDTSTLDINTIDISTVAGAETAITKLDTALDTLDDYMTTSGSQQSRIENTINGIRETMTELASSAGRAHDVDIARENLNYVKGSLGIKRSANIMHTYTDFSRDIIGSLLNGKSMPGPSFKSLPLNVSIPNQPSAKQVMSAPTDLYALSTALTLDIVV